MSDLRQAFLGMVFALLSGLVILGGAVLALVESNYVEEKAASATYLAAWDMSGIKPNTPVPGGPAFTAVPVGRETLTPTPTFGPVGGCSIPEGWVAVMTRLGDTLAALAQRYQVAPAQLAQANCLASENLELTPGIFLFVPAPTVTATPILPVITQVWVTQVFTPTKYVCGAPWGWVSYRVRSGDTLYNLGRLTGVSVYQIQLANCMGNSTLIVTGQYLYLPFYPVFPTATPLPTWTLVAPTATPAITVTPTVIVPTPTISLTPFPPTSTITATPETPTESPTMTPTPPPSIETPTPVPSATTAEPVVTPTATLIFPSLTPTNSQSFLLSGALVMD